MNEDPISQKPGIPNPRLHRPSDTLRPGEPVRTGDTLCGVSVRAGEVRRARLPGESWWQSLAANTPVVVIILDRDHRIRFHNHAGPGHAGPGLPSDAAIGQSLYDFCLPEYSDAVRGCVDRVFATGRPDCHEGAAIGPEAENRRYASFFGPIFEEGEVAAVSLLSVNLSDADLAAEALWENKQRYQELIEALPCPVYRCDGRGRIVEFNSRWYQYTGQSPDIAASDAWMASLHPDDRLAVQSLEAPWSATVACRSECRLRRASDGSYRWHLDWAVPVPGEGGEVACWIGVLTEIDEQRQILHEAERREAAITNQLHEVQAQLRDEVEHRRRVDRESSALRQFADVADVGFATADLDGKVTYASASMGCLLGGASAETIGIPLREMLDPPSRVTWDEEIFPGALREGRWTGQVRLRTADGGSRPVLLKVFLVQDDSGTAACLGVAASDLTARFEAEAALLRVRQEWEMTFDAVPDLIALVDNQHRIVSVNRAMAAQLGVSPEQCVGRHCHELVHGLACPPADCPHAGTLADGLRHQTELHDGRLGGRLLVTTTPLLDEKQRLIGSVHVARPLDPPGGATS